MFVQRHLPRRSSATRAAALFSLLTAGATLPTPGIGLPETLRGTGSTPGLVTSGVAAQTASAQAPADESWNGPRVLRLLDRAQELRGSTAVDPAFRSYHAEARGHVFFLVDRPDSATNVLVKGDQVALDLYWQAPTTTKQWIVGRRDERVLPTRIRYHLDHLTVIQDDFGDFIRLGDGDEVEAVLHPVGPEAEERYDYLLSDSLTISYAGGEVRVYEVRVRPKRLDQPGFVGTVFLDRDRAAIVRMNFSFTRSAYVDPYLDYIRIALDNALWMGEYWLPYRQETEIRREMPMLDFMAGSTIRTRFDIGAYDFNVEIPPERLRGPGVRAVSPAQRAAFEFERGIFDPLEEDGRVVRTSQKLEEVREQVREVVEDEVLSGLAPLRLHLSALSDFARYNRAEGLFLGGGATLSPTADLRLRTTAGYAFGRDRASAGVRAAGADEAAGPTLHAYWDRLTDIGGHPGATPLENTIGSVSGSRDLFDPYFTRGGSVTLPQGGPLPFGLTLRAEEHVGARDVVSDDPDTGFRPVRSIEEGTFASVTVSRTLGLPGGGTTTLAATGARMGDRNLASMSARSSWVYRHPDERWHGLLSVDGAWTDPDAPPQSLWLIGGRHTLIGSDYRGFVGNAYGLVRAEATIPVYPPYVGIRLLGAVGATHLGDVTLPADWPGLDSDGVRASVGLGLSMGWDTMRIDVGRSVRGGGWEAVFSVAPQFRSWM